MIIYKYTCCKGKDILFNSRLKVNDPINYNDPFEFALNVKEIKVSDIKRFFKNKTNLRHYYERGVRNGRIQKSWKDFLKENTDPAIRKQKILKLAPAMNNDLRKVLSLRDGSVTDYFFLCCFAGPSVLAMEEVLLWAHYSDGLRGLRFSIETDLLVRNLKDIEKVKYTEKVVELDPKGFLMGDGSFDRKTYELCLITKSKAWEYEQEYRWTVDKNICAKDALSGEYFTPINLKAIKRIDFGEKCSSVTIAEVVKKIKDLKLEIDLKKAVQDSANFKLNYVDLEV